MKIAVLSIFLVLIVNPIFGQHKVTAGEWIDLGLPSVTLWCSHNVDAKEPEQDGRYYQWGRMEYLNSDEGAWKV